MSVHDSLVVKFGDEEKDCQYNIFVEVDKNPCKPNETVTIKVYGANYIDLQYIKLYKEEQDLGSGQLKIVVDNEVENIVFDETIYAATKYPIQNINSTIATTSILKLDNNLIQNVFTAGSQLVAKKYSDSCIRLADTDTKLYGSVDIDYEASKSYKEYLWQAPNIDTTITYPFFVLDKETELDDYEIIEKFNITVEKSSNVMVDVKFYVKDIANDLIIKNAQVTISQPDNSDFETIQETTNEDGYIIVSLMQGETYNIHTLATNYIDSENDYISNDSFTVPTDET